MNTLNLDILINTPKETIIKDVNQIFSNLLNEIQNYLDLAPINPNMSIIITKDQKEYSDDFFNLGVRRTLINNQNQIKISEKYLKLLEFILLRESYLVFIPYELRENKVIQIVIHEIIESDLFKLEVIDEWKKLVRSKIINYNFLSSQFDKLDKFFKLEATETTQSPTQFFFEFIRRNIPLIHDKMDDFYDILYEEFIYKISKSLYNDEILETIRILVEIFYHVKLFKNYNEFEAYFQDFKEKGIISTTLSKRKFSENLRWINKYTIISPSFQPIYHKIDIAVVISILKFNPILNRKDIYKILDKIPFLNSKFLAKKGFSEEIHCLFVIPRIYLVDLLKLIENLFIFGYTINKECYIWKEYKNFLNLNYFRNKFSDLRKIINPNHKEYSNQFELEFSKKYNAPQKSINLDLLDWIVFERVRQTSLTGFGFERREETLKSLKDEVLNHIESENVLISDLKASLNVINASRELKEDLINFLEKNRMYGFFYIGDMLQQIITSLNLIENLITQNSDINSLFRLQEFLKTHKISNLIEVNTNFKNKDIQLIIFRDILPLYFSSVQKYYILKEKYSHFLELFTLCRNLKIFSIESMKQILKNEKLIEKIYRTKEKKLAQSFAKFKPYRITNQILDSILKKFIEKDLISPELIKTIIVSSFAKFHPLLILKCTQKVIYKIEKILKFFPRVIFQRVENLFSKEDNIILFTYFLNIKEKELFCSIIYNIFKEDLLKLNRYFTSGLIGFVLVKDFYDFDRNEFFFTKDLFEQSFLSIQNQLGELSRPLQVIRSASQEHFWGKEHNILKLVNKVNKRVSYEQKNFNIKRFRSLSEFNKELTTILLDPESFRSVQNEKFFKNFIKSIKFIPNFQAFGLDQYYLYIRPSNVNEVDFKHLLINTFQTIKYPTSIDDTSSFLIKYIFPFRNPNMKHLNWYTKTKHIIQEYCLFSIKKVYQILNFNYNLSFTGWNYDSNRFKIYMQNILFNQDYKVEFAKLRQFNMMKTPEEKYIGFKSTYFNALTEIYTWRSIDIKSFLATRNYSVINNFKKLVAENLIFPYIKLRNLNFQDKISLILPDVKEGLNQTIIKIFNFFNYGFIYEIEGEYYIHGLTEQIRFENGLMIILYLPQCELDEFLKLFDLLLEYFEINNYIVLTDLTNGKNLLSNIYKDLSFLNSFNPLFNLKWNEKDKIWINYKLYTEKFEKLYPALLKEDKD
ncbi:MAG: hypothetical protein ACFFA7_10675 [Promethearchaeota archaeon]